MSRSLCVVIALALLVSCSPKRSGPGDDDGAGGSNGSQGLGGSACASDTVTAQNIPLDIYLMLDQSLSMADASKWPSVTSALASFVGQPNLDGMSVGLGYFAVPSSTFGDSCNPSDYATPSVEIAPLPGVATAITSSMAMHGPSTATPTVQALEGAIQHAQSWASTHAGDAVVVVLATDGVPEDLCTPEDVPSVESVATMGRMTSPGVRTFVIGVGSELSSLDGIAAAGGTGSAYLVDTSANAGQQFLAALDAIRGNALGCTYQIPLPASGTPDYQAVNVVYTPGGGGMAQTVPYVGGQAQCPATGNGWYYDNAASPTQIILCQATCQAVEADTTGSVAIELGCATVIQ